MACITQSHSITPSLGTDHSVECNQETPVAAAKARSPIALVWLLLLACLFPVTPAFSQELTDPPSAASPAGTPSPEFNFASRQYLLGDWGGVRSKLAEQGVKFDFYFISDLEANPTGGLQHTRAGWNRIRGTVDINFDKMIEWKGLNFHATGLWQSGVDLGTKIGTLANPSDLVSAHTTRLDSFWLEQFFGDHKLRIRAGQLAGMDLYGNQEYGGSWLIEPLGYAFGNLFRSIFESFDPAGTPGAEVRIAPTQHFYVKSSVMSGNRDPYKQDPNGFYFTIRDSPDFLFETGYVASPENGGIPSEAGVSYTKKSEGPSTRKTYPGVYKFGGVYNGGKFANPQGIRKSGNYLIYGMASQALFRAKPGSNRGLDATFGFDYSPADVARENVQVTAGALINAPLERRPKDKIGIGFVYSRISDPFSRFSALLGGPLLGSEKAFELNYSLQVTPFLLLEPVFQYYADVGGNAALPNAAVLGFRTKVTF